MGRHGVVRFVAAVLGASLLVLGVTAAPSGATGDRPTGVAAIQGVNAKLLPSGSVTVTVKVGCARGWQGGEINVRVSNAAGAYAEGFVNTPVVCNGRWQRERFDIARGYGTLKSGTVTMSSQLLVTNVETGDSAGAHNVFVRRLHH